MTKTLTLLDTTQVQGYLFSSNRLKHNLAASYLVDQACTTWIRDIAPTHDGREIYAAGGNAALYFPDESAAKAFAHDYTHKLITDAPGLRVVIQHTDFEQGKLAETFAKASKDLAQTKLQQPIGQPLPGMSVTAVCDYTGLPAVNHNGDDGWLSAELECKRLIHAKAREKLLSEYKDILRRYKFAYDFNKMGVRGKSSYIAVIHADGNGMGKRKQDLVTSCIDESNDDAFINKLNTFSANVSSATKAALSETLESVIVWIEKQDYQNKRELIYRDDETDEEHLKFVPIVTGGDDVTLVCDGRLGLSLAAMYLKNLSKQSVEGKPLYACAGVAVVGNRFPFRRAYGLAEELCRSAKDALRDSKPTREGMALDWHIANSGIARNLGEIREREYKVTHGQLHNRPVFVGKSPQDEWKYWDGFRKICSEFNGPNWRDSRNKVKELREVLRSGSDVVKNFRTVLALDTLPKLDGASDAIASGWLNSQCIYFDAIEAMDLFVDMESQNEQEITRA